MNSDQMDVRVLPSGEWRRRLHAPYCVVLQDTRTGVTEETDPVHSLEIAIRVMVTMPNFPLPNRRIAVVDRDGWIALGYSTDKTYVAAYGRPAWWGSEMGFALLESMNDLVDPIDQAIMETWARDVSGEGMWWKT